MYRSIAKPSLPSLFVVPPTMAMSISVTTRRTALLHSLQSKTHHRSDRAYSNAFLWRINSTVKYNHGNRRFSNIKAPPNPYPVNGIKSIDVTVDHSRKLWFRTYVPTHLSTTNDDQLPVIVFFHGGGFVFLSADASEYDAVCRRFAGNVPAIVVSVDYRLAPDHRYPAQYEDGFDVLKFLDENKKMWPVNADLSRCFLAGDSAGGNIAHNVAVRACQTKFLQLKVIGVVAIQPFFGGVERTEAEIRLQGMSLGTIKRTDWVCRAFLPQGLDRDHQAINVSGSNAIDLSCMDFPATLVIIGGDDPLQDWQMRYYEWLKRSGKEAYLVEYPNMCHSFFVFPELPESGKLILDVANFIHQVFKNIEGLAKK